MILLAAALTAAAARYVFFEPGENRNTPLNTHIQQIVTVGTEQMVIPCSEISAHQPLVLLALGQSNAGNHGTPDSQHDQSVTLIADGKCLKAHSPLPGATGLGASIWQRLPGLLNEKREHLPVVLSVLAVDSTTIEEWTDVDSPLRRRLMAHVDAMNQLGLGPHLILWQQGEANARQETGKDRYMAKLRELASVLESAGTRAPILLAKSTRCLSPPNSPIRSAIEGIVSPRGRFREGPDTDILSGETLRDGCHFTAAGLDSAARMWVERIDIELNRHSIFLYTIDK